MQYFSSDPASATLIFGHGAGAGQDHPWIVRVAKGLAARGVRVVTFDFPYRVAKRKVPDPPAVLEKAFAAIWQETIDADRAAGRQVRAYFAGGKSMGGRISSQATAHDLLVPAPAGLVFFGYPLHPPGKPDQRRDAHLPAISVPMLFIHGTRDPFGTPEEMHALVGGDATRASEATLEVIDGGDHSLIASKGKDPDKQSLERAMDIASGWILRAF